ncbi:HCL139Cp [Eremothecium sinecaudum]|uniref:HCL139Cp n=1 Tax=Eremothecium sinecaudum TaxID=45286 RepID=A0A120K206_9SACH|nr:HCL139Cp [Eremothecium sinecaudum]AMD20012.1 HCL139Cp [Eremothecium sinecaudum]
MVFLENLFLSKGHYKGRMYEHFPKTYNIYVIAFTTFATGIMYGFDIASMSSQIRTPAYLEYFNYPSAFLQGLITSSMAAGSFFGSLLSSSVSDAFGRRVSLHVCATLWIIGSFLQCGAQNRAMLIVGRVISGAGIGFGSSAATMYCSEISPPKIRGLIGSIFHLCVTFGMVVLFYIGYAAHFVEGPASFRITWGSQLIPGFLSFLVIFFLPESPRWLATHDRWDEAHTIVAKVNAKGDMNDRMVLLHMQEIEEQVANYHIAKNFGYLDLFRKASRRKTIVGISAQTWQQLSGMSIMMYYVVYLFEMAGFHGNTNLLSASIQYLLNFLTTFPAVFLVDKIGRRPILIYGGFLLAACSFSIAGLLGTYSVPTDGALRTGTSRLVDYGVSKAGPASGAIRITIPPEHANAARGVIACAYLFVCIFSPSWGTGAWLYCSEIFNNFERARGSALTSAVHWGLNFTFAMVIPTAFKNITWRTYIIFGVFDVSLAVHTFLAFPETKGKTLEEVEQMWQSKVPAWRSKSFKPVLPVLKSERRTSSDGDVSPIEEVAEGKKSSTDIESQTRR